MEPLIEDLKLTQILYLLYNPIFFLNRTIIALTLIFLTSSFES